MMRWKRFISALLPLAVLCGCQIDPPLHLRQSMEVVVKVLWKAEVYPDGIKPDGVTLYFFREGQYYMQHTTAQVDSCVVQLEPGRYRLYMITQSPEEYWKMEFDNMEDFKNASVSVAETKSSWYSRAGDEMLIQNPEMMTAGVSDEFEVSEEMVMEYNKYISEHRKDEETGVYYYTIRVPVNPESIVSQYWVTIYSSNADVLKSVRASTSGMARTFLLTQGKTGDGEGTQFITEWTLTMDDELTRVGHLDGKVTTFGFPRGELPSTEREPSLNVSTLLIDNETIQDWTFYVGDKIVLEDPPEGYRYLYRLIFGSVFDPAINPEDVHPSEDSSGFDVIVDEWGNGTDVEIDM